MSRRERETPTSRTARAVVARLDVVVLALVAYLPFLASSPGELSSDSKQALYVDPGGFLRDAPFLWDPTVAAGTVPHQHVGYLWPMGPWFWLFDTIGAPDWVAQRLWLGSLTLTAALGARWLMRSLGLGRMAALAGAVVYALTPYQLAFTARTSVLLLPWVGLPWLVELTRRAVHRGGWRHPALFALVTFSAAGVNAASLVLVAIGPLVVLIDAARPSRLGPRATAGAAARIGVFTLPICLWWLAGLRVQGGYGIPVLQVTENLRTVAERSSPDDVLRGLGNWFFYGRDRAGWSLDQTDYYEHHRLAIALSFVIPVLALSVATVVRWSHRWLTVGLVASMVIAVGAWPYDQPSPVGRLFRVMVESTSAGLAFRNHPRVVPVLILGLALILAAGVRAMPDRARWAAASVVVLAALGGLAPVARVGMLTDGMNRPETLPDHWVQASRYLDEAGSTTRVLEVPGANFADYRWGNAVEPVTPLLLDRPYLAREILPQGSTGSTLLLDALDRRIQNGVLDPDAVAPIARFLASGTVVLRNDLRFDRFDLPGPDSMWNLLVGSAATDLATPTGFGEAFVNRGNPELDSITPSDLQAHQGVTRDSPLPPVAVIEVAQPTTIVGVAPVDRPVLLAGDADGMVDAAAAGLLDGRGLVLLSGSLSQAELSAHEKRGAALIVTDSHRRRIQTWFYSLRDTRGATEEAGETMVEPSGYDARLHAFPAPDDRTRTVAHQIGATVRATSAGGGAERPEDRPVAAVDGRLDSSWRVGGSDPTGERLTVTLERPQVVDRVVLIQPQDGPRDRTVTRARLRFDDGSTIDVDLGPQSLRPDGQVIEIPEHLVASLTVEIVAVSDSDGDPAAANAVGFAEIGLGDLRVQESVLMPRDLLERLGSASLDHSLDLVLTRLRTGADLWRRSDDEVTLDRTFHLPTARSFSLVGTARPSDDAADRQIDELLGTAGTIEMSSSSRLQGSPGSRASRAVDGDPSTAWTASFDDRAGDGPEPLGGWIEMSADRPFGVAESLRLDFVADGRHSLPAEVTVTIDGQLVTTHRITGLTEGSEPGDLSSVTVPLEGGPRSGRSVQIAVTEVVPRLTDASATGIALPVAIAEVGGVQAGVATTGIVDPACRGDLVQIDGEPVSVRLGEPAADGTLTVTACEPVDLAAGTHRLTVSRGSNTGIDADALTLSSAAGGEPGPVGVRGLDVGEAPARVTTSNVERTTVKATVQADGDPFWFVLAQSASPGWQLEVDGGTAGPRSLVNGYADGWMITPTGSGPITISLRWQPQQTVWVAMAVSLTTLVLALAVVASTRPSGPVPQTVAPTFAPTAFRRARPGTAQVEDPGPAGLAGIVTSTLVTALVVAVISRPWIGLACAAVAAATCRWRTLVWLSAPAAGIALALARPLDRPELGWLALGVVIAVVIADALRSRAGQ